MNLFNAWCDFFDLFFFFQFVWKTCESCIGTCLVEGTSLICEVHFTVLWLYDLVQENLCNELQRYRSENAASWNRHKIHVSTVESSQLALAVRKCSYMGICRITNPINRSWFFSFSFFFFFSFLHDLTCILLLPPKSFSFFAYTWH